MKESRKLSVGSEYKVVETPPQVKIKSNAVVVQKQGDSSNEFILVFSRFMKRHYHPGTILKSGKKGKIEIVDKDNNY